LQLWHAQPADIQHMNVGDEVVLEGEPSYISKHRMIGRIVEWRHK
jgi:exopolysaccharide biosynthesis predicted pyruvyltransferase EpsI